MRRKLDYQFNYFTAVTSDHFNGNQTIISPRELMSLLTVLITCLITLTFMPLPDRLNRLLRRRKRKASSDIDIMASFPRKQVVQEAKLLGLPNEILILVISFLDFEDLLTVRLTSSHLDELAQPFVYSELDVSHGLKAERLAKLIRADDRKAKWLKSVLVSTKHDHDEGLTVFPDQLRRMRNLKHLILETPDCNARASSDRVKWLKLQAQYDQIFAESSVAIPHDERLLPSLETCTMHFVDNFVSLYPLPHYKSIFLHPTLQDLTISCMCTDRPAAFTDHKRFYRTTALTRLHLEESDFDPDTLAILLKLPQALKSLRLSEGVRYTSDFNEGSVSSRMHGNMNPGLFSQAISRSVADSLEHLSISLGYKRRQGQSINSVNSSLNFTALHQLKFLEISMSSLGLLISRPGCDHAIYTRLPPSIEHIRVFNIPLLTMRGSPAIPFEKCVFAQKKAHGLPNLKQVTYCYEYQSLNGGPTFLQFAGARRRDETFMRISGACKQRIINNSDKNYYIYKNAGIRVVVELEVTPHGFIPPYLHHEEKPVRGTFWDSNEPTYEARIYEGKARRAELANQMRVAASLASGAASSATQVEEEDSEEEQVVDVLSELPAHGAELFQLLVTGTLALNQLEQ